MNTHLAHERPDNFVEVLANSGLLARTSPCSRTSRAQSAAPRLIQRFLDGLGILGDVAAGAIPAVPGILGLSINASRNGARLNKSEQAVDAIAESSAPKNAKSNLPSLDSTGKVHRQLPRLKDLKNYSNNESSQLRDELKQNVRQRIKKNIEHDSHKPHGERQAAEQQLIKSIDKALGD